MATYDKMKVKAGRTWMKPGSGVKIFITRVDGTMAYYTSTGSASEKATNLMPDGSPKGWDDGWVIEKEAAPPPPATLIDFFNAVPDGHCPCNIPRTQCRYHQ